MMRLSNGRARSREALSGFAGRADSPTSYSWRSPRRILMAGADVPDAKRLAEIVEAVILERPEPEPRHPRHLCPNKGYDTPAGRQATAGRGCTPYMRLIPDERPAHPRRNEPGSWLVGRTPARLSRSRAILVGYGRYAANYLDPIKPACGLPRFRRHRRLTEPR